MIMVTPTCRSQFGQDTQAIIDVLVEALNMEASADTYKAQGKEYEADIIRDEANQIWERAAGMISTTRKPELLN